MMQKNLSGQKWVVQAWHRTTGNPVAGDAANITAALRPANLGGAWGDADPLEDLHPQDLGGGYYAFDLTQAETNADHLLIIPVSATTDVIVMGAPPSLDTEPTGRKYPATLAPDDCSAALPAEVQNLTQGATAVELGEAVAALALEASVQGQTPAQIWSYGQRILTGPPYMPPAAPSGVVTVTLTPAGPFKWGEIRPVILTVRQDGAAVDLSGTTLALAVKRSRGDSAPLISLADAAIDKTQAAQGVLAISLDLTIEDQGLADVQLKGELAAVWPDDAQIKISADFSFLVRSPIGAEMPA